MDPLFQQEAYSGWPGYPQVDWELSKDLFYDVPSLVRDYSLENSDISVYPNLSSAPELEMQLLSQPAPAFSDGDVLAQSFESGMNTSTETEPNSLATPQSVPGFPPQQWIPGWMTEVSVPLISSFESNAQPDHVLGYISASTNSDSLGVETMFPQAQLFTFTSNSGDLSNGLSTASSGISPMPLLMPVSEESNSRHSPLTFVGGSTEISPDYPFELAILPHAGGSPAVAIFPIVTASPALVPLPIGTSSLEPFLSSAEVSLAVAVSANTTASNPAANSRSNESEIKNIRCFPCTVTGCEYAREGKYGGFKSRGVLRRHESTMHRHEKLVQYCSSSGNDTAVSIALRGYCGEFECPEPDCPRKGSQAFSRKDNLTVHLRNFHGKEIKRRRKHNRDNKINDESEEGPELSSKISSPNMPEL